MKRLRIKNQKKFNRFIILLIITFTLLLYLGSGLLYPSKVFGSRENQSFTVMKGDTVWSIARAINSDKDTREVVYDIYKLNNMPHSESIYPGQILKLPIY